MRVVSILAFLLVGLFHPGPAEATQQHGGPEGLVAHQLAHLFFIFSMIYLYRGISRFEQIHTGLEWIRRSAALFVVWNLITFLTHMAREFISEEAFKAGNILADGFIPVLWYAGSLIEHFFLIGATLLFLVGLRRLSSEVLSAEKGQGQ